MSNTTKRRPTQSKKDLTIEPMSRLVKVNNSFPRTDVGGQEMELAIKDFVFKESGVMITHSVAQAVASFVQKQRRGMQARMAPRNIELTRRIALLKNKTEEINKMAKDVVRLSRKDMLMNEETATVLLIATIEAKELVEGKKKRV